MERCKCGWFQSRTDCPSLTEISDLVEESRQIPVSMDLVPQLEAKITAVNQWKETAKNAFIAKKNPRKLFEVF